MGTLRWEKEAEKRAQQRQRQAKFTHKRRELQFAEADIGARISARSRTNGAMEPRHGP